MSPSTTTEPSAKDQPKVAPEEWRGVAAEHADDVPAEVSTAMKSQSRKLLGELLRPWFGMLWFLALVVVLENLARLSIPFLVHKGIDNGLPAVQDRHDASYLIGVLVSLVVALVVQAGTRIYFLRTSGAIGQKVLLVLRRRLFKHFQRLDVKFHDKYTSGRVISRLTSDVEAIQEMLANGFDGLITAVLTMVGTAVLLLVLDWKMALISLLGFPVLILAVRWFARTSTRIYRKTREMSALVIVSFVESMSGIKAVQAYRREPRNQVIFEDLTDRYRLAFRDSFRLMAKFSPLIQLVGNTTTGVVLLYGGFQVMHGHMQIGVLTAFLLYLRMFFQPMQEISQFYNTFQSATAALEKLAGVLDEQPLIDDPAVPAQLPETGAGRLDLDHVTFGYVPEKLVLPDLDLHIPSGQTVALVGTTGAGKTTIAKLVARFYDPQAGAVRLGGVDLRELDDVTLRRNVIMVTQENFLFDGTIASNIRFGRPDATDEEVRAAAQAVGAATFIDALPDGYETAVSKRGGRFSAGQRQLIAFARAFLADPQVLILDEATSSLDIPSERLVQQALRTILKDRTAIIIAHRLSTVEIADRVLVLEHGRVIEDGSPTELIHADGGRYAALHQAWIESLA